jgi:aspartate kinase
MEDRHGQDMACLLFGAAAWQCRARDQFLGWDAQERRSRLSGLANEKIGKLSIVGVGMRSHPGVAAKMFETLAQNGINIDMISTSEIKVSVTIDLAKGEEAMHAVHGACLG